MSPGTNIEELVHECDKGQREFSIIELENPTQAELDTDGGRAGR